MKKYPAFLLSLWLFAACQPQAPVGQNEPSSPATDLPLQTDKIVSAEDVTARLPFLSKEDQAFVQTPIGRQNLLQIAAREKLITLAAQDEGLTQNADYQVQLTQKRTQLDSIYRDYATQLLRDYWYEQQRQKGALAVSEEEIKNYYDKYPYEMTVKQIVVDNAETADQLLRTLKSSRLRWKEIARQYNTAPEALRGEISFMPGEFLPDIEVIAANSATGSVQGFFKTAYGFHIIMKTGERKLSFEQAEPRIRAVLENKKLDKLIESLQTKYEVVIDDKNE